MDIKYETFILNTCHKTNAYMSSFQLFFTLPWQKRHCFLSHRGCWHSPWDLTSLLSSWRTMNSDKVFSKHHFHHLPLQETLDKTTTNKERRASGRFLLLVSLLSLVDVIMCGREGQMKVGVATLDYGLFIIIVIYPSSIKPVSYKLHSNAYCQWMLGRWVYNRDTHNTKQAHKQQQK